MVSGAVDTGAGTITFTHPINDTPASDLTATYRWSKDLSTFTVDGDAFEGTTVTFVQGTPLRWVRHGDGHGHGNPAIQALRRCPSDTGLKFLVSLGYLSDPHETPAPITGWTIAEGGKLVLTGATLGSSSSGILAMADDMGWGDPGCDSSRVTFADGTAHPDQGWIHTPTMNAMAANGLRFDRFYSASAGCSPTRASCLTGRNPFRVGVPYADAGHLEPKLRRRHRGAGGRDQQPGGWRQFKRPPGVLSIPPKMRESGSGADFPEALPTIDIKSVTRTLIWQVSQNNRFLFAP